MVEKKEVALTFDDGPWKATTPRVLEELTSRNIPATFMIWGEHAEMYPEILERAAFSKLFDFGNHTFHHHSLLAKDGEYIAKELKQTDEIIQKVTGKFPKFIRPPFGDIDASGLKMVNRPVILWSVDTMTWDHHNPKFAIEKAKEAKDGDILLMHDFQEAEVQALPSILDYFQEQGFVFKTVLGLLGDQLNEGNYIYYSRDKRDKKGF